MRYTHSSYEFFSGVDAKLRRAREHMQVLKSKIETIYNSADNYWLENRDDCETSLILDFRPSPDISAVAGDAIQNMRSVLDHLVWDLVLLAGGSPGTHTEFPIWRHPNEFRSRALFGSNDRLPQLCGIKPRSRALRLIVAVQPYYSPNPDEFWLTLLNQFSNFDKHRSLYTFASIPSEPNDIQNSVGWNPASKLVAVRVLRDHMIEGKTEVLRLTFDPSGPPPDVYVKSQFAVIPVFGDSKKIVSYYVLDRWLVWLSGYVDEFRPLGGGSSGLSSAISLILSYTQMG